MRLTNEEIQNLLASKDLVCLNIDDYQNMDTILNLKCKNGHEIQASIRSVRNANFRCVMCDGGKSISEKVSNIKPPVKTGHRIIGIDNATENIGLSIYDNKQLVFYHKFHLDGDTMTRLLKNRRLLEDVIINEWQPDLIVVEDIQYQGNNILTFKTLAMLLGSTLVSIKDRGVKYTTVLSKVWRSHHMIAGKTRLEQKKNAIAKVKNMYNITVDDDVAEAILIGKYAADTTYKEEVKKLF